MKAANLAGAVLGAILKVAFAVIVVYLVYTGASTCYDYGYRIFTEPAISSGEGRKITVTLTSDMSATEIGNTLQEKGLVRTADCSHYSICYPSIKRTGSPEPTN